MADLHVIIGLGATGFSCARYLKSRQIPFAVIDSRTNPPQLAAFKESFPEVQVELGSLDTPLLKKAGVIVLSPGVALHEPAIARQVAAGKKIVGDIELFAQAVKAPVIAITGTNAKSTVTTLVGLMVTEAGLQAAVGGNLGTPALDLLLNEPMADVYVLELSSFQLETTQSLRPRVATVLNITPDHMDRYETIEDYAKAKHQVYEHCEVAVCNRDDPLTDTKAKRKFTFTLDVPREHEFGLRNTKEGLSLAYEANLLMQVKELPVMGRHYHANALAALAIGHAFGLPFAPMLKVLREFKGLPHRCQFVRERHGVRWYNDSKGTNVGATQAAIEGLGSEIPGKLIIIAGGVGKNADFFPMAAIIEKYARHVVLIGEAASDLAKAINGRVKTSHASSMDEAVLQCAQAAQPGDSVLLSPACASFDMFNNYEHRGRVFTDIVSQLPD